MRYLLSALVIGGAVAFFWTLLREPGAAPGAEVTTVTATTTSSTPPTSPGGAARAARPVAGTGANDDREPSTPASTPRTPLTSRRDPCDVQSELIDLRILIERVLGTIDFELLADSVVSRTNKGEVFDPKSDVVDPKLAALFSNIESLANVHERIQDRMGNFRLADVEEVIPQEAEILLDVSEQLGAVIPRVSEALQDTVEELEDIVEGYRASVKDQNDPRLRSMLNDRIDAAASDLKDLRLRESDLQLYHDKTNDAIVFIERYHQVLRDFSNCVASEEGTRARSSVSLGLRAQTELMEWDYTEFTSKAETALTEELEDQFPALISEGTQLCSEFNVHIGAIKDMITELDQTIAKQERRRSEIADETLSRLIKAILDVYAKDRGHVSEMQGNWDLKMGNMDEIISDVRSYLATVSNLDSADNQAPPCSMNDVSAIEHSNPAVVPESPAASEIDANPLSVGSAPAQS